MAMRWPKCFGVASRLHELWIAFYRYGVIRRRWCAEVGGSARWPGRRVWLRLGEAKRRPPSIVVLERSDRPVGVSAPIQI